MIKWGVREVMGLSEFCLRVLLSWSIGTANIPLYGILNGLAPWLYPQPIPLCDAPLLPDAVGELNFKRSCYAYSCFYALDWILDFDIMELRSSILICCFLIWSTWLSSSSLTSAFTFLVAVVDLIIVNISVIDSHHCSVVFQLIIIFDIYLNKSILFYILLII